MENKNKKMTMTTLNDIFSAFSITDQEGFALESCGNQDFMISDFVESVSSLMYNLKFDSKDFFFVNKDGRDYCFLIVKEKFFVVGELKRSFPLSKFLYFKPKMVAEVINLLQN